jgi:hypothetical protein
MTLRLLQVHVEYDEYDASFVRACACVFPVTNTLQEIIHCFAFLERKNAFIMTKL